MLRLSTRSYLTKSQFTNSYIGHKNPQNLQINRNFWAKSKKTKEDKNIYRKGNKNLYRNIMIVVGGTNMLLVYARLFNCNIEIECNDSDENFETIEKNSVFSNRYVSTFWLPFRWMSVIYGAGINKSTPIDYKREFLKLSDGEITCQDWAPVKSSYESADPKHDMEIPIAMVLTGITGHSDDNYISQCAEELSRKGFRSVVATFRGYEIPCKSNNFFDMTSVEDMKETVSHIKSSYPNAKLYVVAFSLGANIATKYCGVMKDESQVDALVSISNPFKIKSACHEISKWKNYIYGFYMARGLAKLAINNKRCIEARFKEKGLDMNLDNITPNSFSNPEQYLSQIYLHHSKYDNLEEFYKNTDCVEYLKDINIPTLFINSKNDFVSIKENIPTDIIKQKDNMVQVKVPKGGHLEYFVSRNALRWCNGAAAIYLRNLHFEKENQPIRF